jgi:putative SbcD/Mre11-related phosphoesterase
MAWQFNPLRALHHAPTATAVIADLHLGYDAARRARGEALPELGWKTTQDRLQSLVHQFGVRRIVVAGDVIEASAGREQFLDFTRFMLDLKVEVVLVLGNHDQGLRQLSEVRVHEEFALNEATIRHIPSNNPLQLEIVGHVHPVVRHRGFTGQAPCFLVGRNQIVLPAFSDDVKGVNVLRLDAYQRYLCHVIVDNEVLPMGRVEQLGRGLKPQGKGWLK